MNQRAFRRALRYGFGRAVLHLRDHDAAPYRDDILDGCLHFWGFDGDFDQDRSNYLFEIISLTGARAFYQERILEAVESAGDDRDGRQLFALARLFAEDGDEQARAALERALTRLPFDGDLAEHVIMLNGPAGLARVLRLRLDKMESERDEERDVTDLGPWIIEEAAQRWGKSAFERGMRDVGRADPRIRTSWREIQRAGAEWRRDLVPHRSRVLS